MYPPKKPKNQDRRDREYLHPEEVYRMIDRLGSRDSLLISLMYHHGLRVSEAEDLRWEDVSLARRALRIRRRGKGLSCEHVLTEGDSVALSRLWDSYHHPWNWLFEGPKEPPELVFGIKSRAIHHIVDKAARRAGIRFPVHPMMLRHSCGYRLAEKLRDLHAVQTYLGLKTPSSAARYFVTRPDQVTTVWD